MSGGIRLEQTAALLSPVESLRYVRGARTGALARMGIHTVRDLIENYPHRYLDMSQVSSVAAAEIGTSVTIVGVVGEVNVKQPRPHMNIVEISVLDGSGALFATWFGQPWIANRVRAGDRVSVSGKVEFGYGFKRMKTPFIEVLAPADEQDPDGEPGRVIALHPLSEGISAAWMRRLIATALSAAEAGIDPLPPELRIKHGLVNRAYAWRHIHFPASLDEADTARRRLAYEELLLLQLHLRARHRADAGDAPGVKQGTRGERYLRLRAELGFDLSAGQEGALESILEDMAAPSSMNRMLLGDVGTGKTAVAVLAMAVSVDSGFQAAMMAPTTVLATQYSTRLGPLLDRSGITWALLTGATSASERADILRRLAEGKLDILFGTHALIQEDVVFRRLGLSIIDEQHRFGVRQRAALRAKGPGCDFLVMTATPIPRTLALVLYGDLGCSYLRERPLKHAPVSTTIVSSRERVRAYEAIRSEVAAGRQAYIVCPLIGVDVPREGEDGRSQVLARVEGGEDVVEQKTAREQADFLARKVFPRLHVGLLTGRMTSDEKNRVMGDFSEGKIDVLVSTTVVEVGVDVPNATVMMVESAECFGLSQLHQLRGRVGRGIHPGKMFLVAKPQGEEARARLEALVKTDDGYALAEYDLRLRHEGDILGSRQSGAPTLKLVDVMRDVELVEMAHLDAEELWECDPGLCSPAHALLAEELRQVFSEEDRERQ